MAAAPDASKQEGPPAKAHRKQGQGFPTRSNYFAVDDIVWVHPKGFPLWPSEVVEVLDAASTKFRCRLFCPPTGAAETIDAMGTSLMFFDKLATPEAVASCIESRLQRKRFNVAAYEHEFVRAVGAANDIVRIVLNPNQLRSDSITISPVGVVHCSFRMHCSAPRQPHVPGGTAETAVIRLATGMENAVRDLKGFEWIWVVFHFSYATAFADEESQGFKCMVVPPRDTVARGVFATRSPHRPNPIGLSCVRVVDVRGLDVHIADHDLLHGTPVVDIKPYLPFCDSHPDAKAGWVDKLDASGKALGDHRGNASESVPLHRNYAKRERPAVE